MEGLLKQIFDVDTLPVRDGRWVLQLGGAFDGIGGATVYVRVRAPRDAPRGAFAHAWAMIVSPVLQAVQKTPALLDALNELNAQLRLGRIYWSNGTVYAETGLFATTIEALELEASLDVIAQVSHVYGTQLKRTFGGIVPS